MAESIKIKLPSTLITRINRLANEEMRRQIWARAKILRSEYAARADAGEPIEALANDVHARTIRVVSEITP